MEMAGAGTLREIAQGKKTAVVTFDNLARTTPTYIWGSRGGQQLQELRCRPQSFLRAWLH